MSQYNSTRAAAAATMASLGLAPPAYDPDFEDEMEGGAQAKKKKKKAVTRDPLLPPKPTNAYILFQVRMPAAGAGPAARRPLASGAGRRVPPALGLCGRLCAWRRWGSLPNGSSAPTPHRTTAPQRSRQPLN
jgi:hypothetical protein